MFSDVISEIIDDLLMNVNWYGKYWDPYYIIHYRYDICNALSHLYIILWQLDHPFSYEPDHLGNYIINTSNKHIYKISDALEFAFNAFDIAYHYKQISPDDKVSDRPWHSLSIYDVLKSNSIK
jgi:hypothetical protein